MALNFTQWKKNYDLSGKKFGKLTVVKFTSFKFSNSADKYVSHWLCKCECGGKKEVSRKLLKSGKTKSCGCIQVRKYDIDEKYFEKINRQDKAYLYGFILTDGNISTKKVKRIIIKISDKDDQILKTFKKYLKTKVPIGYQKERISRYKNYNVKSGAAASLTMGSSKMVDDIIKLGLKPAKTKNVNFPSNKIIPHKFMNHFIRGVYDGDGTVGPGHIQFTSGSLQFLKGLKKYLTKYGIKNTAIIYYKRRVPATKSITIYWVLCIYASMTRKKGSGLKRSKKTGRFFAVPKSKQHLNQKLFFKTIYKNCFKDMYLKRKKEKLVYYLYERKTHRG